MAITPPPFALAEDDPVEAQLRRELETLRQVREGGAGGGTTAGVGPRTRGRSFMVETLTRFSELDPALCNELEGVRRLQSQHAVPGVAPPSGELQAALACAAYSPPAGGPPPSRHATLLAHHVESVLGAGYLRRPEEEESPSGGRAGGARGLCEHGALWEYCEACGAPVRADDSRVVRELSQMLLGASPS